MSELKNELKKEIIELRGEYDKLDLKKEYLIRKIKLSEEYLELEILQEMLSEQIEEKYNIIIDETRKKICQEKNSNITNV